MSHPLVSIEILGGLRFAFPNRPPVDLLTHPAAPLAAHLALNLHRSRGRESVATDLWPDADPETGRARLRQSLYALRILLRENGVDPDDVLMASRQVARFRPDTVVVDALLFDRLLQEAARTIDPSSRRRLLSRAVALYGGELLSEFYADWTETERARLANDYRQAAASLVALHLAAGALDEALSLARRAVAEDPLDEEMRGALMRVLAAKGQGVAALREFHELERVLREQLGDAPSASTRELADSLRTTGRPQPRPTIQHEPQIIDPPTAVPRLSVHPATAARTRHRRTRPLALAMGAVLIGLTGWLAGPRSASTRSSASEPSVTGPTPTPAVLWARRIPHERGDRGSEPSAVTTDVAGNIYLTGFVDTLDRNVDFVTLKYAPDGHLLWQARYNGPGDDVDRARSLAVDHEGNVYVCGESNNGEGNGSTRLSGADYALIKYAPDGKELWVRRFNGADNGEDGATRVIVNRAGYPIVTGRSARRLPLSNEIVQDQVTLFYDPKGNRLWKSAYQGDDRGVAVGDIGLDGLGQARIVMGARTSNDRESDVRVVGYNGHGQEHWVRTFRGKAGGHDMGRWMASDARGNLYVGGVSYGGHPADGGTGADALLIKYSPNGDELWAKRYSITADGDTDMPACFSVSPDGSCILIINNEDPAQSWNVNTLRIDPKGNEAWRKGYNGQGNGADYGRAVSIDSAGNAVVTICADSGQPGFAQGATSSDFVTLKYDRQGNIVWRGLFDAGQTVDQPFAMTLDSKGNVIVAGQSGPSRTRTSDIVILKYAP